MTRALIIGGGVAGPVTAMALQRAGIDAVVYEAHAPTAQEVGSYLTVATDESFKARVAFLPVLAWLGSALGVVDPGAKSRVVGLEALPRSFAP
jgi:hypothetical protein